MSQRNPTASPPARHISVAIVSAPDRLMSPTTTRAPSFPTAPPVAQMMEAFADIAQDTENRVLILTGAGDEFNGPKGSPETFPKATARGWESAHWVTRGLLKNVLEIECPVIAALNGPVWRHCET